MTAPIFELHDVHKAFGPVRALHGVTLHIAAGERVALVGPSGAGKSTLLALLNGTHEPTLGTVRVLGQQLNQLTPRARRQVQQQIGTIYQHFALVDNLRVIHNVNAGQLGRWSALRAIVSLVWPLDVHVAAQALAQVGIPDKLYARTEHLSGGQQQRVAIARVLVQDPVAILADEPISNLDPERGREIMDLLRDLSICMAKTLLVSLHAVEYARSHFTRVIGLRDGRIIFDQPADQVTDEMLRTLYRIDAHPEEPLIVAGDEIAP